MQAVKSDHVIKVIHHLVDSLIEGVEVFVRPPAGHIAFLIELGALGIESVGDLMADDCADGSVILLRFRVGGIAGAAHNAVADIDGIVIR